jgi:hypothetical protein
MVIKRIAPLSAARVAGVIYAMVGLALVLLIWFVSMAGLNYSGMRNSPFLPFAPNLIVAGGAAAVIVLPIFYGAFSFVTALIGAWLYNVAAGLVGGIRVDVVTNDPPGTAPE